MIFSDRVKIAVKFIMLILYCAFNFLSVQAQNFKINDVIVSDTSFSICDAEYNSVLNMYCHATNFQGLYVGDIDPSTGDFLQPDGLGILLDFSMISTVSTITRNGCEWGLSQQGHDIFYTDSTNQGFGFKLGRMRYSNGNWVYLPVDSSLQILNRRDPEYYIGNNEVFILFR